MTEAYICDALRTPFGRYGGALSTVRADDLAAVPLRALRERHGSIDWEAVDDVFMGCANQAGEDNRNVARMALLLAGLPVSVPGCTLNRLCGSGLDAIATAARSIKSGQADLIVAGGVESMSRAPYVLGKPDAAFARNLRIEDTTMGWRFVNPALATLHGVHTMPETAENVAAEFNVQRADQDAFALRSQQRYARALARGAFQREITPVEVKSRIGVQTVSLDEHPRPDTTLETLARLNGVVRRDGTVTAGNSSGINDGAGAVIVASEMALRRHGLVPRARIVDCRVAGVPPRIMGTGPVPAVQKLLSATGVGLEQIDVVELNEAFAAQALAVLRCLGLPDDSDFVNPNGGAIAVGHPLGASGPRMVATAMSQLETTGGRRALCTMCIGVGQGIAMLIERT